MYSRNNTRKYQKEYGDYIISLPEDQVPCTYHNFADRMRYKKATKWCTTVAKSPKRKYDVQYNAYCQTTINPVPYAIFANRIKSLKYREKEKIQTSKVQMDDIIYKGNVPEWLGAKFVTPPPIDPVVPEKKKFLTPFLFDIIVCSIMVSLWYSLLTIYLIEKQTLTPITNTVIVKVKEKIVYKTPVKKVSKPVLCAK